MSDRAAVIKISTSLIEHLLGLDLSGITILHSQVNYYKWGWNKSEIELVLTGNLPDEFIVQEGDRIKEGIIEIKTKVNDLVIRPAE
jgi:hypothetical protein